MTTLAPTPPDATTRRDRGTVLAVLTLHDRAVPVLRYAALVASVDSRRMGVLVVRARLGFTADASLAVARNRLREHVHHLCDGYGGSELAVDELVVSRRTLREPHLLWEQLVRAARARDAAAVVVPQHLGATAPRSIPGTTVVTVLGRPHAR